MRKLEKYQRQNTKKDIRSQNTQSEENEFDLIDVDNVDNDAN